MENSETDVRHQLVRNAIMEYIPEIARNQKVVQEAVNQSVNKIVQKWENELNLMSTKNRCTPFPNNEWCLHNKYEDDPEKRTEREHPKNDGKENNPNLA